MDLGWALDEDLGRIVDLGSGGGLPGLPLALALPDAQWILLEGGTSRASFLSEATVRLGIADRVSVLAERAEEVGRGPLRGTVDAVVARSFGPPAVTSECAAPLLRRGGQLVVAEPPDVSGAARWDRSGLAQLGLALDERSHSGTAWQGLRLVSLCPSRYPRRTGIPAKRPLF